VYKLGFTPADDTGAGDAIDDNDILIAEPEDVDSDEPNNWGEEDGALLFFKLTVSKDAAKLMLGADL